MLLQTFRAILHDAPAAPNNKAQDNASESVTESGPTPGLKSCLRPFCIPAPGLWEIATGRLPRSTSPAPMPNPGCNRSGHPPRTKLILPRWKIMSFSGYGNLSQRSRKAAASTTFAFNPHGFALLRKPAQGRERLRLAQMLWKRGSSVQLLEARPCAGGRRDGEGRWPPYAFALRSRHTGAPLGMTEGGCPAKSSGRRRSENVYAIGPKRDGLLTRSPKRMVPSRLPSCVRVGTRYCSGPSRRGLPVRRPTCC